MSIDPSAGNPKPRLFRLPEDRAIVVHYGLPNDGARAVRARLDGLRLPVPLGVNLVKTNRGPGAAPETHAQIIGEYVKAAHMLAPYADYLMLNLSCPNTEDGRDFFADGANLGACLAALAEISLGLPVFLKISPLGGIAAIERLLAAADRHAFVSGFMFNLPPVKPDNLVTPEAVWRAHAGRGVGPSGERRSRTSASAKPSAAWTASATRSSGRAACSPRKTPTPRSGWALRWCNCSPHWSMRGRAWSAASMRACAELLARDGFASVSEAVGVDAL